MAQFRNPSVKAIYQSLKWLGLMRMFNTGLQWKGQQFPCILRIASTTKVLVLLSSRLLFLKMQTKLSEVQA